jgi:hypothetical protein
MKKYLPFVLLAVGILILVIAFVIVRGKKEKADNTPSEEVELLDLSLDERPLVTLAPTLDGHYLIMKIEKIGFGAFSLDYELIYQVPGGLQQGVPGSVSLSDRNKFEAELLLGSESSGKFRYDEGVETGTLTLRFRNEDGQLLARFSSEFHLQNATGLLTSTDEVFKYELDTSTKDFFITMNTVGVPGSFEGQVGGGPYGVFTSSEKAISGTVGTEFGGVYRWDSQNWEKLDDNKATDIGIFIGSSSE